MDVDTRWWRRRVDITVIIISFMVFPMRWQSRGDLGWCHAHYLIREIQGVDGCVQVRDTGRATSSVEIPTLTELDDDLSAVYTRSRLSFLATWGVSDEVGQSHHGD